MLAIAGRQHMVMTHEQLLALGFTKEAIIHRLHRGRLHRVYRGVYAVGSPRITEYGHWMAATLYCGPRAALSHEPAALLWGFFGASGCQIEVSMPRQVDRRPPGVKVHRRSSFGALDVTWRENIPVTSVPCTITDLAARLDDSELERAISEAVSRRRTTPEHLLSVLKRTAPRPGTGRLRELLTRHSFRLTDSELERIFIPIAIEAGLPVPSTRQRVNGFRVDFHWPELGLVVETDSLSFHRDPFQQRRDRLRDQAHTAAGLTQLRFTHRQVYYDREHVGKTLRAVGQRLLDARSSPGLAV